MPPATPKPPPNFWGDTPATEEEYHASHQIQSTKSFFTSPHTASLLFTRSWLPPPASPPRAAVFMLHGYNNDISWTFQSTPILLARARFACFALDLPGHGRSAGLRASLPDLAAVADDCIAFIRSALASRPALLPLPKFLYGESLGGALCLLIHLRLRDLGGAAPALAGAVLVAPMCRISDAMRPWWPVPQILAALARFMPALPAVPAGDLVGKSVKVGAKRAVARGNPMRYSGRPRLGTVAEMIRATDELSRRLGEVSLPFLVLHGSGDVVTDPAVSRELYAAARSADKSIRIYEGVWHSLQFGETEENLERFRRDVIEWLEGRCGGGAGDDDCSVGAVGLNSERTTL